MLYLLADADEYRDKETRFMDMETMHPELGKDGNGKMDIGTGIGTWTYGMGQQENRDNRKREALALRAPSRQRMSPAREHSFHLGVSAHYDTQTHSL